MPSRRASRFTDIAVEPFNGQSSLSCRYTIIRSVRYVILAALQRSRILGRLVRPKEV